jgi:CRISPR system Cascade subunit CasB
MENPAETPPKPAQVVQAWWSELTGEAEPGKPGHRGEFAQLRRCKELDEVLFAPEFYRLYHRLSKTNWRYRPAIAAVAGILAHVRGEPGGERRFAAYMAVHPKGKDGPRVLERRFRRLVANKNHRELYPALIRIVHLADNQAPVADLAQDIYSWNDRTRRDWTFDYYNKLLDQEKPQKKGA